MDLSRFIEAQSDPGAGYAVALHEIRTSGKESHWIWYIFPQLKGLGGSPNARFFALADLNEARAFMAHPLLGGRLTEISEAVVSRLRGGVGLVTLMGSSIDVMKLVSRMTLFAGLAERAGDHERLFRAANDILKAAQDKGYPPCAFTKERLGQAPPRGL